MPQPVAELPCGSMQPHSPHTQILARSPWVAICPGIKEADQ